MYKVQIIVTTDSLYTSRKIGFHTVGYAFTIYYKPGVSVMKLIFKDSIALPCILKVIDEN